MLTFIFIVLMFAVFGKLLKFAVKATWGISKMVCSVILFPLFLIVLVVKGLIEIALPILVIVGCVSLLVLRD
uniref:hypothetical protein n=1 Tax=Agathobacter sp. TaxID=2021311 RepID=UPI0040560BB9